jgi:hypothetical protein
MKITEKIIDLVTGEETLIEREETVEEITARIKHEAEIAAQTEAETAKVAAQAKLAALGLTADDLKALGLGGN